MKKDKEKIKILFILLVSLIILSIVGINTAYNNGYDRGINHEECRVDLKFESNKEDYFMVKVASPQTCNMIDHYIVNKNWIRNCTYDYTDRYGIKVYECN